MDEFGIGVGLYYRQLLLLGVVSIDQSEQSIRNLMSRGRAEYKHAIIEMSCSAHVFISHDEHLPVDPVYIYILWILLIRSSDLALDYGSPVCCDIYLS